MDDAGGDDYLSWENLIYVADFLEASGDKHIALLGGEPSLHPNFIEFIVYLLERNFHVNIFTSGIMSEEKLNEATKVLSGINPERLSFVCNLNNPLSSNFSETESVKRFLKALGHLTSPGFNIYKPDFDLDFIFQYINQYGLKKHLRLGLAHPIPGKKNTYVGINEMKKMAKRLLHFEEHFARFRVTCGLDCGFPLCIFTDDELGKLYKISEGHLNFGCGPAVDIGTDMSIWCCFPLSNFHKKSIFDFDNIREVVDFYLDKQNLVKGEVPGIYEECDNCLHAQNHLCSAGCAAHMLSWFKDEKRVRMEGIYHE
jgi:hypothetical protein